MRKVRDTCLFSVFLLTEHDPVSMHLCWLPAWLGLSSPLACSVRRWGGCREWVNPTNCDCVFKMWCSAGGKQDPSKFMPLCEREEKGSGVEVEGIE